jgi:hypothetical protein
MNGRGPGGLPLMQPNEQLTTEQLKKRTEKLGKLKDISSLICPQQPPGGGMPNEMVPAVPTTKRGRNSANQKQPQVPPQPPGPPGGNFMNGSDPGMMMYPGGPSDQFNPMMPGPGNMPNPYQMDNKDWNRSLSF